MTDNENSKIWVFNSEDDIKIHSVEKYKTVKYYMDIFSTSMKDHWTNRVYIDLFAGPGLARLKDSNEIIQGSPALSLSVKYPFTQYIFCESDPGKVEFLKNYIKEQHKDLIDSVHIIEGDCNQKTQEIVESIQSSCHLSNVLSFCFVDPYKASNFKFKTLEILSGENRRIDYLVLIPTNMDLRRNVTKTDKTILNGFFGCDDWTVDWEQRIKSQKCDFGEFAVEVFGKQMKKLGYLDCGLENSKPIARKGQAVIYHLCFYSRHPRAMQFWEKVLKGSSGQMDLFR